MSGCNCSDNVPTTPVVSAGQVFRGFRAPPVTTLRGTGVAGLSHVRNGPAAIGGQVVEPRFGVKLPVTFGPDDEDPGPAGGGVEDAGREGFFVREISTRPPKDSEKSGFVKHLQIGGLVGPWIHQTVTVKLEAWLFDCEGDADIKCTVTTVEMFRLLNDEGKPTGEGETGSTNPAATPRLPGVITPNTMPRSTSPVLMGAPRKWFSKDSGKIDTHRIIFDEDDCGGICQVKALVTMDILDGCAEPKLKRGAGSYEVSAAGFMRIEHILISTTHSCRECFIAPADHTLEYEVTPDCSGKPSKYVYPWSWDRCESEFCRREPGDVVPPPSGPDWTPGWGFPPGFPYSIDPENSPIRPGGSVTPGGRRP